MDCRSSDFHGPSVLPHEAPGRNVQVMENMAAFFTEMLQAVAAFLGAEPVIYLFGLVCLSALVKIVKDIIF